MAWFLTPRLHCTLVAAQVEEYEAALESERARSQELSIEAASAQALLTSTQWLLEDYTKQMEELREANAVLRGEVEDPNSELTQNSWAVDGLNDSVSELRRRVSAAQHLVFSDDCQVLSS